jgi:hypothetical protein
MNDVARRALRDIINTHGTDVYCNAKRCKGLLRDWCASHPREINILSMVIEEHVPADLLSASDSTPREILLSRLARRLEEHLALTEEAANWAVESWALALGVISDADVDKRVSARTSGQTVMRPQSQSRTHLGEAQAIRDPTLTSNPKPQSSTRGASHSLPSKKTTGRIGFVPKALGSLFFVILSIAIWVITTDYGKRVFTSLTATTQSIPTVTPEQTLQATRTPMAAVTRPTIQPRSNPTVVPTPDKLYCADSQPLKITTVNEFKTIRLRTDCWTKEVYIPHGNGWETLHVQTESSATYIIWCANGTLTEYRRSSHQSRFFSNCHPPAYFKAKDKSHVLKVRWWRVI